MGILEELTSLIKGTSSKELPASGASSKVEQALTLWRSMYLDSPPWKSESDGKYTQGIPTTVAQSYAKQIMLEFGLGTNEPETARPWYEWLHTVLAPTLNKHIEEALCMGGTIIKPYLAADGTIGLNVNPQGSFVPISFDDKGELTDVAFIDTYREGDTIHTRIERHKRDGELITITNKAYAKKVGTGTTGYGDPIALDRVAPWRDIAPAATVQTKVGNLFAYYRVPSLNTADPASPLGASIYARAAGMIERADAQFSRIDWEYTAAEMAIDMDPDEVESTLKSGLPANKQRLFRRVYAGDSSYEVFAPTIRSESYLEGLNKYRAIVEEIVALPRGTLSVYPGGTAYTNEKQLLLQEQRFYAAIKANQAALDEAIRHLLNAVSAFRALYKLGDEQAPEVSISWEDAIVSDTQQELKDRIELESIGVLSAAEVRAWYTGEDLETARANVEEIKKQRGPNIDDLFRSTSE